MIDLNKNVLGKIKAREILGAEPDIDIIKNMLEKEIKFMIENLENLTKQELVDLKTKQVDLEASVNSRPGAMALPQKKIRLFTEYNSRYVQCIEEKINLTV